MGQPRQIQFWIQFLIWNLELCRYRHNLLLLSLSSLIIYGFFHHLDLHWDMFFQHEPINCDYFPTFLNLGSTIMSCLFNIQQIVVLSNICFCIFIDGLFNIELHLPFNKGNVMKENWIPIRQVYK